MRMVVVDERDVEQEIAPHSFRVWALGQAGDVTVYECVSGLLEEVIEWARSQPFSAWSLAAVVRLPGGITAVWLIGRDPSDTTCD